MAKMVCLQCGTFRDGNICGICGTRLVYSCGNCGAVIWPHIEHCEHCGCSLKESLQKIRNIENSGHSFEESLEEIRNAYDRNN